MITNKNYKNQYVYLVEGRVFSNKEQAINYAKKNGMSKVVEKLALNADGDCLTESKDKVIWKAPVKGQRLNETLIKEEKEDILNLENDLVDDDEFVTKEFDNYIELEDEVEDESLKEDIDNKNITFYKNWKIELAPDIIHYQTKKSRYKFYEPIPRDGGYVFYNYADSIEDAKNQIDEILRSWGEDTNEEEDDDFLSREQIEKLDIDDVIGWIFEHEWLYSDFCEYFDYYYDEDTDEEVNKPELSDIIEWLYDHSNAWEDFKSFFDLNNKDESLKESKTDNTNKKELVLPPFQIKVWETEEDRDQGEPYICNYFDRNSIEKAIKTADRLFKDSESVEVYNKNGELVYGLYNDDEEDTDESLKEDTVKQNGKWVNKGKEGTHGKFKTKKQADAQRKAMFANGYKGESIKEDIDNYDPDFDICCQDVADALDSGYWHGTTSSERRWGLIVNGGDGNQFSPSFADAIAYECSYPVRDGYFSFDGLDCIPNKSTFAYTDFDDEDDREILKNDLLSVGCNEEEIEKFFNDEIEEIEFYIDYEIDIDDLEEYEDEDEDADESLKEASKKSSKYEYKGYKEGLKEDASNNEWENYGDINFLTYGGTLLKEVAPQEYEIIRLFTPWSGTKEGEYVLGTCYLDTKDYEDSIDDISKFTGEDYSGLDKDKWFAVDLVDYYGTYQLGGTDEVLTKDEVVEFLKDKGVNVDELGSFDESLKESKKCDIKLTTEEKNMLDKLTSGNKMDCWFWIDDKKDAIVDLENNKKVLNTCDAILTVNEGTVDIEKFLNEDEIKLFNDLVARCKECKKNSKKQIKESSEEDILNERYEFIDSKQVYDSDGMITEYTMYYDTLDNKYVFVFGDSDLYKPEDEDFDWECETRDEAEEWFSSYGEDDDLEDEETSVDITTVDSLFTDDYVKEYPLDDNYFLFLEGLTENGESCYEVYDEFSTDNINRVLVEIIEKGSGELFESLDSFEKGTPLKEIVDKAKSIIGGEEEASQEPKEESLKENDNEDNLDSKIKNIYDNYIKGGTFNIKTLEEYRPTNKFIVPVKSKNFDEGKPSLDEFSKYFKEFIEKYGNNNKYVIGTYYNEETGRYSIDVSKLHDSSNFNIKNNVNVDDEAIGYFDNSSAYADVKNPYFNKRGENK